MKIYPLFAVLLAFIGSACSQANATKITQREAVAFEVANKQASVFSAVNGIPRLECGKNIRERAEQRLCKGGTLGSLKLQKRYKPRKSCYTDLYLAICER